MKQIWFAFMCMLFVSACGDEFKNGGGAAATCGIVAACAANSHCEGNTCVCNAGFALTNGACVAIPDAGASACGLVATCASNSHCENNACICNQGFALVNGACAMIACGLVTQCAVNSHCENNACVCDQGCTLINGVCVVNACGQVASCAANTHCENSACVCNTGYAMVNGACAAIACGLVTQCAANSHCENNACACDSGFTQVSGVCTRVDGGGTVGPGCVGSACVRFTHVRVTVLKQSLLDAGWTFPTLWTSPPVLMKQGSSGSLVYEVQNSDIGYLWITVRRSTSSSEEVAPNACQTAVDFGLKIEGKQPGISGAWVDLSALIPAERDTDAANGRRKFRWWIIDGERASFLTQHPCN